MPDYSQVAVQTLIDTGKSINTTLKQLEIARQANNELEIRLCLQNLTYQQSKLQNILEVLEND